MNLTQNPPASKVERFQDKGIKIHVLVDTAVATLQPEHPDALFTMVASSARFACAPKKHLLRGK